MMQVILSGKTEPFTEIGYLFIFNACNRGIKHIKNEYPQNEHGHCISLNRLFCSPSSHNRQAGEHESHKGAAAVTQKNTGSLLISQIVRKKSETTAQERNGKIHEILLSRLDGEEADK